MRLFGRVNGHVTREDRPGFYGLLFTLGYRDTTPPAVNTGLPISPAFGLSPRLSMYALDMTTGRALADLTAAYDVSFGTDEHGFADLRGVYRTSPIGAMSFYARNNPARVVVSDGLNVIYDGRMEDVGVSRDGMTFGALGFWRAMSDIQISALFSDSRINNWYELNSGDIDEIARERYETDKSNRLYMAPTNGESFGSTAGFCSFGYRIPDLSLTQIRRITFNYVLDAPSPWRAELSRCDADWNVLEVVWSLTGNGTAQVAADQVVSVDPCDALRFTFFHNGAAAEYTGETGEVYFRVTNPVVRAFDKETICADDIITTLVDTVNDINPTQLSADISQINCPGINLTDARYEDVRPTEIINELAIMGDVASPPQAWAASVWEDRRMRYAARGSHTRNWYVDVVVFEIERSLDDLVNTAYGIYRENGRGTRRTATATVRGYEIARMSAVDVDTTSRSLAESRRDVFLGDSDQMRPRAVIRTTGLYDKSGGSYPLYRARAGDYMTLRNLPPDIAALDSVRTFRIGRTRYHVDDDMLEPEPEQVIPSLAIMVARGR